MRGEREGGSEGGRKAYCSPTVLYSISHSIWSKSGPLRHMLGKLWWERGEEGRREEGRERLCITVMIS